MVGFFKDWDLLESLIKEEVDKVFVRGKTADDYSLIMCEYSEGGKYRYCNFLPNSVIWERKTSRIQPKESLFT